MLGRQTGTRPTDGKRHWLLRGRATNIFDAKEERRAGISVERRRGKGAGRYARDRRERGDPAGDPGTDIAVAPH